MEFVFATVAFLLVSLIIFWIRFRRERFSIFKRHGIPGPEPNFWLGNFNDFIDKKEEELVKEWVEKYGKVIGCFLGAKPVLIVADEELAKIVQVKEATKFTNRDGGVPDVGIPQPDFLSSMPMSHDEEWKMKRSLVSPSFSLSRLKKLMPILKEAHGIFMEIIEKSTSKEYIDVIEVLKNLFMDIVTKAGLGIDTGVQHKRNDIFLKSADLFLDSSASHILIAVSLCFPELEPIPTKLRNILDTVKYYVGFPSAKFVFKRLQEVMDRRRKYSERREDLLQGIMDEKIDAKKLLSMRDEDLVASNDNKEVLYVEGIENDSSLESKERVGLADDSIRGTAAFLLVAGYDTSSVTLCHLIYYLAKYQDVQERLRDEINTQIGEKKDVEYEDIQKLTYMEQVIAETLRLRPTNLLSVTRICKEPFEYKGMTIPKGITIAIPLHYLHKNPVNWSDPKAFKPERFSPENKNNIHPYMYQPFGNGPRNCAGMRFANLALKLVLANLIRSYRIRSYDNKEIELQASLFVPQPKNVRMKFEPISH